VRIFWRYKSQAIARSRSVVRLATSQATELPTRARRVANRLAGDNYSPTFVAARAPRRFAEPRWEPGVLVSVLAPGIAPRFSRTKVLGKTTPALAIASCSVSTDIHCTRGAARQTRSSIFSSVGEKTLETAERRPAIRAPTARLATGRTLSLKEGQLKSGLGTDQGDSSAPA
jgi:hypothetical protein